MGAISLLSRALARLRILLDRPLCPSVSRRQTLPISPWHASAKARQAVRVNSFTSRATLDRPFNDLPTLQWGETWPRSRCLLRRRYSSQPSQEPPFCTGSRHPIHLGSPHSHLVTAASD